MFNMADISLESKVLISKSKSVKFNLELKTSDLKLPT